MARRTWPSAPASRAYPRRSPTRRPINHHGFTLTPFTQAGLNHLRPIGEGAACLRAARALLVSEEQGEEEQGEEMVEDHALLASEEQGEEHEGEEQREEQGEVELRLRMGGATLAD